MYGVLFVVPVGQYQPHHSKQGHCPKRHEVSLRSKHNRSSVSDCGADVGAAQRREFSAIRNRGGTCRNAAKQADYACT